MPGPAIVAVTGAPAWAGSERTVRQTEEVAPECPSFSTRPSVNAVVAVALGAAPGGASVPETRGP